MSGLDRELVGRKHGLAEVIEGCFGDVDDGAAGVADQVDVAGFLELVERRPGAGVDVLDHSEFVESAEHPVDRRRCDALDALIDGGDQVFCGGVAVAVEEDCDHDPHGHGESTACPANHRIDRFFCRFENQIACHAFDGSSWRFHG